MRETLSMCRWLDQDKQVEYWLLWELYLLRIGSLVVLQEYEIDGNSSGVQENLRSRLEPLIEIQVMGFADYCLFVSKYLGFLLDGQ